MDVMLLLGDFKMLGAKSRSLLAQKFSSYSLDLQEYLQNFDWPHL